MLSDLSWWKIVIEIGGAVDQVSKMLACSADFGGTNPKCR
jgi:hypothetical protein